MESGPQSKPHEPEQPSGASAFPGVPDLNAQPPAGVPVVGVVLIALASLVAGAVLGGVLGSTLFPASNAAMPTAKPEPVAPTASAKPDPSAQPQEQEKTTAQMAAQGDDSAIEELKAKPRDERSVEEAVALSYARIAKKRDEISEIRRKTELVSRYGVDRDTVRKIKSFARDGEVAIFTLRMLTELPGELGPDHLYKLSTSRRVPDEISQLAEQLLFTEDVRKNASPALEVLLRFKELVEAEEKDCEAVAKVLEQAKTQADTRIFKEMRAVYGKRGCGEDKRADCWECLRKPDLVKETISAVRSRKPPF